MKACKVLIYVLALAAALSLSGYLLAGYFQSVTLEWDPSDQEVDGYRLFRKLEGQDYDYGKPMATITAAPHQTERAAPYDLSGGSAQFANPYDTHRMTDGWHTLTALIDLQAGGQEIIHATFEVDNAAGPGGRTDGAATDSDYTFLISCGPDRGAPVPLSGATVSGAIYVFISPDTGIKRVQFFINNLGMGGNRWKDINIEPGQRYCYVARAFKGKDESGDSNEVCFTAPEGSLPETPTGITTIIKDGVMHLITAPVPDGSDKLSEGTDYYEVELDGIVVKSDGQRDEAAGLIRLHHDLSGISEGNHTVRIRGVNDLGPGEWSAPFGFGVSLPPVPSGIGLSAE